MFFKSAERNKKLDEDMRKLIDEFAQSQKEKHECHIDLPELKRYINKTLADHENQVTNRLAQQTTLDEFEGYKGVMAGYFRTFKEGILRTLDDRHANNDSKTQRLIKSYKEKAEPLEGLKGKMGYLERRVKHLEIKINTTSHFSQVHENIEKSWKDIENMSIDVLNLKSNVASRLMVRGMQTVGVLAKTVEKTPRAISKINGIGIHNFREIKEAIECLRNIYGDSKARFSVPEYLRDEPIDILNDLHARPHNCLIGANYRRIGEVVDVLNKDEERLLRIHNFGRKCLRQVKEALQELIAKNT